MRETSKTNLAAPVLMACAVKDGVSLRFAEIATASTGSFNPWLQVVHALQASGFVETFKDRSGGLCLTRPVARISMGAMFRAFEAGAPVADCFSGETKTCALPETRNLRGCVARALKALSQELDRVMLADMTKGNCGLAAQLAVPDNLRRTCSEQSLA